MNAAKTDGPDPDDLNESFQKLPLWIRVLVYVGFTLSVACAFVLLMAALGGLFALLAWPLHAWLGLEWLPAFGIVVALFFAAGSVVAYYKITTQLETIRASVSMMGIVGRVSRQAGVTQPKKRRAAGYWTRRPEDGDSDSDGDSRKESHAKVIQFDSATREDGKNDRSKK